MRNRALEIYAYVVCGVSLLIGAGVLAQAVKQSIVLAAPSMRLSESQVRMYGNNDHYRNAFKESLADASEDDVTRRRLEAREVALEAAKQGAIREQLENVPLVVLFLSISWFHWRIVRRDGR
jgi:hypothetical protein